MPPLLLQGIRFAIAAAVVGIYTRRDVAASTARSVRAGLALGLLLGAGYALQTVGQVYTTASKAAFLTGTMVVFTPLLQVAVERRRPTAGNMLGLLLVCAGMYLLAQPAGGTVNEGDLLVLGCALVYAFYIVFLDVFTRERFAPEIVFWQFVATSGLAFACAPLLPMGPARFTPAVIGGILYLAVLASVVASYVHSKYQRETTPTKAAIIFTMEPVIAAAVAAAMLGERMTAAEFVGAALMVAGLLASELLRSDRSPA
jgi:drug/metabolite transporter (DMT)-like permease